MYSLARNISSPARPGDVEIVTKTCSVLKTLRVGPGEEYQAVAEAVAACSGGEEVLIQEGTYELTAPLVIEFNLTLTAEGTVQLNCTGTMVRWESGTGLLRGLHMKQRVLSEEETSPLIEQLSGSLTIENCQLEGRGGPCVYSHGMSLAQLSKNITPPEYSPEGLASLEELIDNGFVGLRMPPRLQVSGSTISSKRGEGLFLEYGASGLIENCEVLNTRRTGVAAFECLGVTICRNRIHDSKGSGVALYGGSGGQHGPYLVEDNEVSRTGLCGIEVMRAIDVVVLSNRVHHCKGAGLLARLKSKGSYETNEVYCNALANMEVTDESSCTIRSNVLRNGSHVGLLFRDRSRGVVEENEIYGNVCPNVEVRALSAPRLRKNKIHSSDHFGVLVRFNGEGEYIENEIYNNALAAVHVHKRACITLRANHIHNGRGKGVFVEGDAMAYLEENLIHDNAVGGHIFEPPKWLKQTWGQWLKKKGWNFLDHFLWDLNEDPEEGYPAQYEQYAQGDYRGDFDGFSGEVVYTEEEGSDEQPVDRVVEPMPSSTGPETMFMELNKPLTSQSTEDDVHAEADHQSQSKGLPTPDTQSMEKA